MCGIYGIAKFQGSTVCNKVLRLILKKLSVNSSIRGTHATGYAFIRQNKINIFKHNVAAEEFIKLKTYADITEANILDSNVYGEPYSIIGHTRRQTQGSHQINANNHPICVGTIVGVHNGIITNDNYIFKYLKVSTKYPTTRIAQVDSEAIFSLTNYFSTLAKHPKKYSNQGTINKTNSPTTRAIIKTANKLTGTYTCALVDADSPKYLWLFKNTGQLVVHYYKKERLLIFASVESFINNAVKSYKFSEPDSIVINNNTGLCIDTENSIYEEFSLLDHKYITGSK